MNFIIRYLFKNFVWYNSQWEMTDWKIDH